MNAIINTRQRREPWVYMPGAQGAVGSTQVQTEWRRSTPSMALRFDPEFAGERSSFSGSNVSSGQVLSYVSGGGPARVLDSAFGYRHSFKNANGFTYDDIVANPDRTVDAVYANIPDYTWRNQVGSLIDATNTGDSFPVDSGLIPHAGIPRGGSYPTIVSQNSGVVPAWVGTDPLLSSNVVEPHGVNSIGRDIYQIPNKPVTATRGLSEIFVRE
jgi:hypothetical protein